MFKLFEFIKANPLDQAAIEIPDQDHPAFASAFHSVRNQILLNFPLFSEVVLILVLLLPVFEDSSGSLPEPRFIHIH